MNLMVIEIISIFFLGTFVSHLEKCNGGIWFREMIQFVGLQRLYIGGELKLPPCLRAMNAGTLEHEHKCFQNRNLPACPTIHPYTLGNLSGIKLKIY